MVRIYMRFSSPDDHLKRFTLQFYIHPFTHTFIQCIYVQHFLYEKGQFGVQYLAQGHFDMWNGEDWESNGQPSGERMTVLYSNLLNITRANFSFDGY